MQDAVSLYREELDTAKTELELDLRGRVAVRVLSGREINVPISFLGGGLQHPTASQNAMAHSSGTGVDASSSH